MQTKDIENNVIDLLEQGIDQKEFIYEFLLCYGISKASITRLKKGDFNLSKVEGEVLYKKKIFFKEEQSDRLLSTIDTVSKEDYVLKHKPRFAILTDFQSLVAKDLSKGKALDIKIEELPKHFDFFLPLAGSEVYSSSNENEADRNAAYKMAELYDLLIRENHDVYQSKESIHHLNVFLSRLLFCFFAEDTGIFKVDSIFTNTLAQHTSDDGSDTNQFLDSLFERLNTESASSYADYLQNFEYVNGGLFKDNIQSPIFNKKARDTLIGLGDLNWQNINPDIFGSMIQAVVDPEHRSDLGMHYTSVPNILKLIKPLFLDELYEAYEKASTVNELQALIQRISKIKFFDPACGSGNFLIITYKEIRVLEIKIIQKIIDLTQQEQIFFTQIELSQFYGIEIDDFAHEVAILSLWLAEHQMNLVFEDRLIGYGESKPILPLKDSGQITRVNATQVDWREVCPITKTDEVYIIGNPPFSGARKQKKAEKDDMDFVFKGFKKYRNLDYVSCWFYLGSQYIKSMHAKLAFVSTNSICQGQQVSLLWPPIFSNHIEIEFAYNSFKWTNNAKGNAGVSVIIVGLRNCSSAPKYLFNGAFRTTVKSINAYLKTDASPIILERNSPLSRLPKIRMGNMPNDGGGLLLTEEEKNDLINHDKRSEKYIRPFLGSDEFIKGKQRYCLWIDDENYKEAVGIECVLNRIEMTRQHRLGSKDSGTKKLAQRAHQFRDMHVAKEHALILPKVSSDRREYIPCGYLDKSTVVSDLAFVIYDAETYVFAVVNSKMHMVWNAAVGGKFGTGNRYSKNLIYNTFPFPEITEKQKESLSLYVFAILDERAKHPSKTMAQLYNPDTMPTGLLKAHQELDTAIEQCYRLKPFESDTERLEYLFKLYEKMINEEKNRG